LEQGQPHLLTRQPQGLDVFDLCFDFSEVTHFGFTVDGWKRSTEPFSARQSPIPQCGYWKLTMQQTGHYPQGTNALQIEKDKDPHDAANHGRNGLRGALAAS
jgi:hypothetical protein